ncbi:Peptidoglycan/xylan/chitin deacetylase, PgdA/CDA1 family [Fontibacillus panacisegetis]|uniref:Peptidoglycan/xylan/chitin deacetylase, PgdA/CDA1 family n=1 Tax=Fontibacillus panacisegetis TaxID=670482 RepID=A0A1G7Q957_9BACL|nr:polysaccharide deacetylase family protein [Fontibacillus panacisegetis]SDF95071.1 Peptidoglycan/xylan/chitin deacetylase, PgdA/CDA1 family [Fontibacillus panacisegetis]
METLLLWLFYISSLYAFIPGLITRLFGFRVFRHGSTKDEFALTFDDGPDPVYTPKLLDLLKRYGAKATFFVVGSNAEKNPHLIRRMYDEGHLVGIHNYVHKTNWLMFPDTVKKQIQKTNKIIYEVTGKTTHYYRPPWGIVNLFDFAKRNDTQIVLWSSIFNDWRVKVGADRLTKRMLKKLRGGEVFLLHDCGATLGADNGAPGEMLIALERVLEEAQRRGLRSIRIDEMIQETERIRNDRKAPKSGTSKAFEEKGSKYQRTELSWFKQFIVTLWLLWEKIFHLMFQLQTTNKEDPIFHFRFRPYHGKDVAMDNGDVLRSGDRILELHFDNKKLFTIGSRSRTPVQLALQMIRGVEKTLPELASYISSHPETHDVKAVYGVSMINRGPEKFGFTVTDLPKGWFATSSKMYLKFLLRVIHPSGNTRVKKSSHELVPKLIVMSMDTLMDKYLKDGSYGSHHRLYNKKVEPEEEDETALQATMSQQLL